MAHGGMKKKVGSWEGQKMRIKPRQNIEDGKQQTADWEIRTELLKNEEGKLNEKMP